MGWGITANLKEKALSIYTEYNLANYMLPTYIFKY